MQNNKKTVRALLLALNNIGQPEYEYKGTYDYKFSSFFNDMTVERKVVVFNIKTPVLTRHFKSDEEMIIWLLEEIEKWENGSIEYKPKIKKKKGRKPKNKEVFKD